MYYHIMISYVMGGVHDYCGSRYGVGNRLPSQSERGQKILPPVMLAKLARIKANAIKMLQCIMLPSATKSQQNLKN